MAVTPFSGPHTSQSATGDSWLKNGGQPTSAAALGHSNRTPWLSQRVCRDPLPSGRPFVFKIGTQFESSGALTTPLIRLASNFRAIGLPESTSEHCGDDSGYLSLVVFLLAGLFPKMCLFGK